MEQGCLEICYGHALHVEVLNVLTAGQTVMGVALFGWAFVASLVQPSVAFLTLRVHHNGQVSLLAECEPQATLDCRIGRSPASPRSLICHSSFSHSGSDEF